MRYQKVFTQIWNDEKFTTLSVEDQRIFLYLLTCPHSNLIGIFVLKEGYVIEDLKISSKSFNKSFNNLIKKELIQYDKSTGVVMLIKFLKHNPITNPNQQKAGIKILQSLPKTTLLQSFKEVLKGLKEGLTKGLAEGILYTDTDSVTASDTDSEEKKESNPEKVQHLSYVFLYPEELGKLIDKFGIDETEKWIEKVDRYAHKIGEKKFKKKYDSHYHVILEWHEKDEQDPNTKPRDNGKDYAKEELLSALKNENNKTMPAMNEAAKKLFFALGKKWTVLQESVLRGETI